MNHEVVAQSATATRGQNQKRATWACVDVIASTKLVPDDVGEDRVFIIRAAGMRDALR